MDLYNDPHVSEALVFRGGTALNKLFLKPPSRHVDGAAKARINGAENRAFNVLSVLLLLLAKMDIGEMGSPHS